MTSIKFRALTHNDHKLFFEALGEHGKDFQNIQQYIAQKQGGKGSGSRPTTTGDQVGGAGGSSNKTNDQQERREPQDKKEEDKKREQIRNFYNKLYAKLSQLVGKLDDRVERVNQELYLLINYGEVWKKHGFKFNNKTKKLLEELVYQGTTTLRFKNKNVRLRTPSCKALKKINKIGIDEKVNIVTTRELPKDVVVEFLPAKNRDWFKVQSISQNPRVRAKLSIQKRVSSILEFLENKWNVSPDKLSRTVDAWIKVPAGNVEFEAMQAQLHSSPGAASTTSTNQPPAHNNPTINSNGASAGSNTTNGPLNQCELHSRLRLKPSSNHELKEVNITRVVPDSHLDLSLTAYISRLGDVKPKLSELSSGNVGFTVAKNRDTLPIASTPTGLDVTCDPVHNTSDQVQHSPGALSSHSSRLPVSLTTPDSSILLERSCPDQPSAAQARKQLNMLQSLAVSFEMCENSRTNCEDTSDRSLLGPPAANLSEVASSRSVSFGGVSSIPIPDPTPVATTTPTVVHNHNIPALFDENAAIDTTLPISSSHSSEKPDIPVPGHQASSTKSNNSIGLAASSNADSQNSQAADFQIPQNLTLGDWFKMKQDPGGDETANDGFPSSQRGAQCDDEKEKVSAVDDDDGVAGDEEDEEESGLNATDQEDNDCNGRKIVSKSDAAFKPALNHLVEIEKIAEGWTRHDESSSMTIGELYLAFKCPDKIVLEYEFEQFTYSDNPSAVTIVPEAAPNSTLIFKLLTAASLSLAQIERQKQEQQPGAKLKRRKGGPINPIAIKYLKTNPGTVTIAGAAHPTMQGGIVCNSQQVGPIYALTNLADKSLGQVQTSASATTAMTLRDIEATNQRVEEALKQLQPTRLSVFRRAR